MKKRMIPFLLCVFLLVFLLPAQAAAQTWTTLADQGGWLLPCHVEDRELTHVRLPAGVRNIGEGTFRDCRNLQEVDMPGCLEGQTGIGSFAFQNCLSLEAITIPQGTRSIGRQAFQGCGTLKEVVIPGSVERIGEQAFADCASLETLILEEGVREIEAGAFENCKNLKTVILPGSLERIGRDAFLGCGLITRSVNERTRPSGPVGTLVLYGTAPSEAGDEMAAEAQDVPETTEAAPVITLPVLDEDAWKGNVLRKDVVTKSGGRVFGSSLYRKDVEEISFLNSLGKAPDTAFDVSEAGDGSVLAWTQGAHLYIAAEGGVEAPENCSGLFCGYTNVKTISFDGNFHTDNATTMSYMFSQCSSLEALDVSGFDTARVERMECMFMHCYALTELDLRSFDVARVFDMGSMFYQCSSLKNLDLSSFVGKDGRNTGYMFEKCPADMKVKWS